MASENVPGAMKLLAAVRQYARLLALVGFNLGVGYGGQLGTSGWAAVAKLHGYLAGLTGGGPGIDLVWTF